MLHEGRHFDFRRTHSICERQIGRPRPVTGNSGRHWIRGGHQTPFKTVWRKTLRRAKIPYFRIYDLRSRYATRLSAGGVADPIDTRALASVAQLSAMKISVKITALTVFCVLGTSAQTRQYKYAH